MGSLRGVDTPPEGHLGTGPVNQQGLALPPPPAPRSLQLRTLGHSPGHSPSCHHAWLLWGNKEQGGWRLLHPSMALDPGSASGQVLSADGVLAAIPRVSLVPSFLLACYPGSGMGGGVGQSQPARGLLQGGAGAGLQGSVSPRKAPPPWLLCSRQAWGRCQNAKSPQDPQRSSVCECMCASACVCVRGVGTGPKTVD